MNEFPFAHSSLGVSLSVMPSWSPRVNSVLPLEVFGAFGLFEPFAAHLIVLKPLLLQTISNALCQP